MANLKQLYKAKLKNVVEATSIIKSNKKLCISMGFSQPPAILNQIALMTKNKEISNLNVYYFSSNSNKKNELISYELCKNHLIFPNTLFIGKNEREIIKLSKKNNDGKLIKYVPVNFSEAAKVLGDEIKMDYFVTTVGPMDKHGYFNLGIGNDYSSSLIKKAKHVILEVNENMPQVNGIENHVHISEVDFVVENHVPLLEKKIQIKYTNKELAIAKNIAKLIKDGDTLQMGMGVIPYLITQELQNHKNLGIHTDVLTPGLANLMKSGVVNNSNKKINIGKTVFSYAIGNKEFYEFLNLNQAVQSFPSSYVNSETIIAQNDNFISINPIIEIDIRGSCNAEHIKNHQFSGVGGQIDLIRGARKSKNGKSFLYLLSTARKGTISKIVDKIEYVTTITRNEVDYVVTEYGVEKIWGLNSTERALKLISLADPKFRDALKEKAKKMNLI